jgi:FtsP/CotA-like multicopper oxidase with cupredoxin domain
MIRRTWILSTVALALCSLTPAAAQTLQPPGWDAGVKLTDALDLNPDPNIVEINLRAEVSSIDVVPAARTKAWTYNGRLPGPLIRAHVGDRLIVHFSNALPQPTTVHWHGVRVPINMDGVPGVSQDAVEPGGSFTYDFVVRDAGLFWYHPHVMSAAQVGFGLYGALLVEEREDTVHVPDELVMVLSDIAVDDDTGTLHAPDNGGVLGNLLGREGNHLLVNGRTQPTLPFRAGALQRWRLVNAAKSRYFDLVLGNAQPFMLIGVDGGMLEYSVQRDHLVLAPGERMDVLVAPRAETDSPLVLRAIPFNRGFGSTEYRSVESLMTLVPDAQPPVPSAPLPQFRRKIAAIDRSDATPIRLELILNKSEGAFGIQGGPFWQGTSVRAALGETQLWAVTNNATWAHPIHLHGYFFQVVDEKGIPVQPIAWKDTINVPADTTVRFLVRLDRPGSWMYHCHILDHAEAGLMSTVDVGDAVEGAPMHKH